LEQNNARYALSTLETQAHCLLTMEPPAIVLDIKDLAAAYLGGTSFAALTATGRIYERERGAVERADSMFASILAPWIVTDW